VDGTQLAFLASLPWIITPIITAVRLSHSVSLDDELADPPPDPPFVSVVIPARNEARNIEACVRSILTNDYPAFEVVVVDDQSSDGTGDIARRIATGDPRVRVVRTGAPPEGWFGKQWACQTGANDSKSEIVLFADADTRHRHDLITRSINAMLRRNADLFTLMGSQELGSFWERMIQPQVFSILLTRYGGSESITKSKLVTNKIANGQCLFVRRAAYDELGGHSLVKSHVADDLMMAQRFFKSGRHVVVEQGVDQLSTRMYTSLGELIAGWGKNVFAGGRDAVPLGWLGRLFFPITLLSAPVSGFLPALILIASIFVALPHALILFAWITQIALWISWTALYLMMRQSPVYAAIGPIGAAMTGYIFLRAMLRGQRVTWKGRSYVSR
jgi:glycosyltransferase involved in cell wall biosynthesis